ncbi:MAG: ribonuclease P protein component [Candidatus Eisenbacteria bacterium]|uniref:Ribonuclease P protein component n=1 Tax=Eiseniibacteriota bacterium TaxID=2212470 RepID=A0A849SCC5_UNCEI|nr:ribonuclease P protein component [Candidatus Eisenbacteria bacterium]
MHPQHRLTQSRDYAELKARGTAFRGRFCLLVVCPCGEQLTRVGFVASKRGVGNSVQRNRARRRLREIVRRRWDRVPTLGSMLMFVAFRSVLVAPHQDLASDVERVLSLAGVLSPVEVA